MARLQNQASYPSLGGTPFKFTASPQAFARYKLSGAGITNSAISVASGSSAASTVHSCGSAGLDEVYLWCGNYSAAAANLYLGIGSTSEADSIIVEIASQSGLIQVLPGTPYQDTTVYAWASSGSALNLSGYVLRHSLLDPSDASFGYDGHE